MSEPIETWGIGEPLTADEIAQRRKWLDEARERQFPLDVRSPMPSQIRGSSKRLTTIVVLICAALLTGCASTRLYEDGKPILTTQANASHLHFTDGSTTLDVDGLDHSTATRAGGDTVTKATMGGAALIMAGALKP